MKDPYQVLELQPSADETAVRQRYLELVRSFPPERSPERFAEIRAAYEELHDPLRRLKEQLFEIRTGDTLEDIVADVRTQLRSRRIPTEALLSLAEIIK